VKVEFRDDPIVQIPAAALVVVSFEDVPAASGTLDQLPAETRTLIAELETAEFSGKSYECVLLQKPPGLAARRLLVVGAGKHDKFDANQLRRVAGAAVRHLRARGIHDVTWVLHRGVVSGVTEGAVQAIVEGAILADYDADRYRSERTSEKRVDRLDLATDGGGTSDALRAAAERGRIVAEATNFTRDLVNDPSNLLTPTQLAEQAETMARCFGLHCQVLGPEEIRALKMGALWAVAQGSDEPPRLIVVRYFPEGVSTEPVVGLVGKGITFDTGGISIKPAAEMHEMKTDMAGGAAMLGVMRAIAQLKPQMRVLAVVPATENMLSGRAFKPGDVITSMSGKPIEILNTDAEGRLVLADGITYAKQQGASVVIDAATLTGAISIALGSITTGVFGWDKDWVNRILAAAAAAGEKMWQLPVDDDYRDLYKSSIADLANTGGRYGGSITAAMFVGEFAGDTPWVHLDIAGTRWSNEEKPYLAKGPTGAPVRTLVQLLTQTLSEQEPGIRRQESE
jgi:leucyl aminopeptidase